MPSSVGRRLTIRGHFGIAGIETRTAIGIVPLLPPSEGVVPESTEESVATSAAPRFVIPGSSPENVTKPNTHQHVRPLPTINEVRTRVAYQSVGLGAAAHGVAAVAACDTIPAWTCIDGIFPSSPADDILAFHGSYLVGTIKAMDYILLGRSLDVVRPIGTGDSDGLALAPQLPCVSRGDRDPDDNRDEEKQSSRRHLTHLLPRSGQEPRLFDS
jgi:hypothetical protein